MNNFPLENCPDLESLCDKCGEEYTTTGPCPNCAYCQFQEHIGCSDCYAQCEERKAVYTNGYQPKNKELQRG